MTIDGKTSRLDTRSEDEAVGQVKDNTITHRCEACQVNFATEADWRFHMESEYHDKHALKR